MLRNGIDLVEIEGFRLLLERGGQRLVNRLFSQDEIEYCNKKPHRVIHLAARMAAKEAGFKALGTGWNEGVQWKNIEVFNTVQGNPLLILSGRALQIFNEQGFKTHSISLSHSKSYAIASVMFSS
ncbi:holo-ACP synthase [Pedobacter sp. GR22-10]|uniref:holo-ACP synthase n=1 Tax=Pedobacter sp. GR22-10 TaxID=2994472 RepID=UPI0022483AA3|nr:holo-ACP synthase [Pedobacter sp. GR22-10]MCX2431626.1 holo-ACP synthase [Pedobacter sp. GR22-10]